jgi:hypothetical protein
MKTLYRFALFPLAVMATPALAATGDGNDKAVWIARGRVHRHSDRSADGWRRQSTSVFAVA